MSASAAASAEADAIIPDFSGDGGMLEPDLLTVHLNQYVRPVGTFDAASEFPSPVDQGFHLDLGVEPGETVKIAETDQGPV